MHFCGCGIVLVYVCVCARVLFLIHSHVPVCLTCFCILVIVFCRPVRSQKDQVFFTVTEKDDVLGHISMPVTVLSCLRGQVHSIALRSHKKCPNPQGDLVFQACLQHLCFLGNPDGFSGCGIPALPNLFLQHISCKL